jgi:hypothetical protein
LQLDPELSTIRDQREALDQPSQGFGRYFRLSFCAGASATSVTFCL